MKQRIIGILKYNKIVYFFYYYIMSFFINLLKLFVRTDDKLIMFNSFAGRKFDDSPKVLFEHMLDDLRFKDYRFVWAFHKPEEYSINNAELIKTDGIRYFKTALSARVWITNSSFERGLHFKGKNTLYINTWHGTPIKRMGKDINSDNKSFSTKSNNLIDYMNTQSSFEADIFSRCFGIPRNHFLEVGLPRNDELSSLNEVKMRMMKEKLNIPDSKKVILYCPTFREYERDELYGIKLAPPIDLIKWEKKLGNDYVLLIRAHYEVSKILNIKENDFVKDVTSYPHLNDLMIASDILISDYSSVFFDYSIMDKCMLHFTYDYEIYAEKRGMYFDIRDWLSGADNEDELISIIENIDISSCIDKTRQFRSKYIDFYGDAARQTVNIIADCIMKDI